jgi:hypothetical protein
MGDECLPGKAVFSFPFVVFKRNMWTLRIFIFMTLIFIQRFPIEKVESNFFLTINRIAQCTIYHFPITLWWLGLGVVTPWTNFQEKNMRKKTRRRCIRCSVIGHERKPCLHYTFSPVGLAQSVCWTPNKL